MPSKLAAGGREAAAKEVYNVTRKTLKESVTTTTTLGENKPHESTGQ